MQGLCDICGKVATLHTCNLCGKRVCSSCYILERGVCKLCVHGMQYK